MNLDLYTLTAFFVGILAGAVGGFWLARFITGLTVERLERKVQSLSDSKFELKGQRVRLKQLEQRLDAEAARIPMAERELKDKTGEIRELTTALNETTALTSDLTAALRTRKAKVQQLQLEQTKWLKRNKALLLKTEGAESQIAELQKDIAKNRTASQTLTTQKAPHGKASNGESASESVAAPALAAGHHLEANGTANGIDDKNVENLTSRMHQMEAELKTWFDRVGKLEANVTGQAGQASGLALLEQVLRGEAKAQDEAAKNDDMPTLLGSNSAS